MSLKNEAIVIIAAYNEEKTIKEVVERSLPFVDVCVINDGSTDKTGEIVKSIPNVTCINHISNTHIPQSILDGMRYAFEHYYEYIITMDAGLSHKPEELAHFINAPTSDLVLGVRKNKMNVPLNRKILSYVAKRLINFSLRPINSNLPPAKFTDVTSGFRRYSRRSVELLISRKLKARTFDFHTETLMIIYRNGFSTSEIPISYEFSNSSLNSKVVLDGFKMFLDFLFKRRK